MNTSILGTNKKNVNTGTLIVLYCMSSDQLQQPHWGVYLLFQLNRAYSFSYTRLLPRAATHLLPTTLALHGGQSHLNFCYTALLCSLYSVSFTCPAVEDLPGQCTNLVLITDMRQVKVRNLVLLWHGSSMQLIADLAGLAFEVAEHN